MAKITEIGAATQFQKGESGNPNGRPKSVLSRLESEIGMRLAPDIPKADKLAILESLLEKSGRELMVIADDIDTPVFVAAIAQAIVEEKKRGAANMVLQLFDRFFGKPKQSVDVGAGNVPLVIEVVGDLSKLTFL